MPTLQAKYVKEKHLGGPLGLVSSSQGKREVSTGLPGLEAEMEKLPRLKLSQVPEGLPALTGHWPGLPYVPSECSRKKAVRAVLCLLASEESALFTRHPTFTEYSGRGQVCGQDCWRRHGYFLWGSLGYSR